VDNLTKVERLVAKAYNVQISESNIAYLRGMIRTSAFHEAGHVVAKMFLGLEPSHVSRVSIVPNKETNGRVSVERIMDKKMVNRLPPELKRMTVMKLLIDYLAGRGVEFRLALEKRDKDYGILDPDTEDWDTEGSDLFEANRVAELIVRPYRPARRVLKQAEKWTLEMLDIPVVWRTVETLADVLTKDGSIESNKAISGYCENIFCIGISLPKWKRRLCVGVRTL